MNNPSGKFIKYTISHNAYMCIQNMKANTIATHIKSIHCSTNKPPVQLILDDGVNYTGKKSELVMFCISKDRVLNIFDLSHYPCTRPAPVASWFLLNHILHLSKQVKPLDRKPDHCAGKSSLKIWLVKPFDQRPPEDLDSLYILKICILCLFPLFPRMPDQRYWTVHSR